GRRGHARLAGAGEPDDGVLVRPAGGLDDPGLVRDRRGGRARRPAQPRAFGGIHRPPARGAGAWENRRAFSLTMHADSAAAPRSPAPPAAWRRPLLVTA